LEFYATENGVWVRPISTKHFSKSKTQKLFSKSSGDEGSYYVGTEHTGCFLFIRIRQMSNTRNVIVRVRGYRTVQSVGNIVIEVPAHLTNEEVENLLEDKHDWLPAPLEWEDLEDEADIEINLGVQPFGVGDAAWDEAAQESLLTDEE
jgi:hypothetical protein